jgi:hypothetical protein
LYVNNWEGVYNVLINDSKFSYSSTKNGGGIFIAYLFAQFLFYFFFLLFVRWVLD